jgi:hypothetical protein
MFCSHRCGRRAHHGTFAGRAGMAEAVLTLHELIAGAVLAAQ